MIDARRWAQAAQPGRRCVVARYTARRLRRCPTLGEALSVIASRMRCEEVASLPDAGRGPGVVARYAVRLRSCPTLGKALASLPDALKGSGIVSGDR